MNNILYGQPISKTKHIFRIMKITVVALLASVFSIYATEANSQNAKVSIHANQLSTKEVIAEIEKQTDYLFVYNKNEVDVARPVSLNVSNESVSDVLNKIFADTNISYKLVGKNISLIKHDVNEPKLAQQKGKLINGIVLDQEGLPIIGANIVEKGTTNGTITDMDGKYSLSVSEGAILHITYIGYNPLEIKVGKEQNLRILMKEDTQALDEVVVVAYGTQKKVNLTAAVETVNNKVLENRPVRTTAEMLEGVVPNLNISTTSGAPDASSSLNIRGFTGMTVDSNKNLKTESGSPLVLVDGVNRTWIL